jgi:UDP-2,4-diacetamido-2,4,6-trideoxy-beta-L-altropyranose hydrolase
MFRCFNFVKALPFAVQPCFVTLGCVEQEQVTQMLKDNNWIVNFLPSDVDDCSDAAETASIAKDHDAALVVTDLCHRYLLEEPERLIAYHRSLKENGSPFILSIEDCRLSEFSSDAAIIWNSNEPLKQDQKANDTCQVLTGTKYFICSPEFSSISIGSNRVRKKANRVLVCIGGSDPKGITLNIVKALKKKCTVDAQVILGDGVSNNLLSDINVICGITSNISIIRKTNSIAELLKWADIAIVGEGLMKCEAAIIGTPSFMISQFDHSSKPIAEFLRTGCSTHLGKADEIETIDIGGAITDLLNDFNRRKKMSANGIKNFDGQGMERVYQEVLEPLFKD